MKNTEKKSALTILTNAILSTTTITDAENAVKLANQATDKQTTEDSLSSAQTFIEAINDRTEAEIAMTILSETDPETAWNVYLEKGTFIPYKIRKETKKGVSAYVVETAKECKVVTPSMLFDAYKEKHNKLMTAEGYMSNVISFYWAFVSNKCNDLEAAPLTLKEKYKSHGASGNDCEKLMCEAAKALYSGIEFKLYRKHLIAINDYITKGTVFKAKIGSESRIVDALIRAMMIQKLDKKIIVEAKGKCIAE